MDHYPIVPAEADAESVSIDGNISSHKSSDGDSASPPSTVSSSLSLSDSDDPFPKKVLKKIRPGVKQNIEMAKRWTAGRR